LLRDPAVARGLVSDDVFLGGYGFTQALPGPLFTFAGFLGASAAPAGYSALWSLAALIAIFLPGFLLAAAGVQLAGRFGGPGAARAGLAGVNAAVVGVLAAAFWNPVCVSGVHGIADALVALCGFLALLTERVPPAAVVAFCVMAKLAS
jgi:chromate transporter